MTAGERSVSTLRRVWLAPIGLALLTLFGLLSALLGLGVWRVLAWAALGVPIVVAAIFALRRSAQ